MAVTLTDTAITRATREAGAKAVRVELVDAVCDGLRLRISPPAKKQAATALRGWTLMVRDRSGALRRFPLGTYPDMSIARARDAANRLRREVRDNGRDPIADRKRDRATGRDARAGIGTLQAALAAYETGKGASLKSWAHSRIRVDRVFADLLDSAIATITAEDLQAAVDRFPAKQSAAFVVRTVRPAFKWLAHRKEVPADWAGLQSPVSVPRRLRALSPDELARVLPVLTASHRPHAAHMRFSLLVVARREEVSSATWGQVDWTAKTLTLDDTKNTTPGQERHAHVIPLSRQAVALLNARKPDKAEQGDLIFGTPKRVTKAGKPTGGTKLGNWDRETKAVQTASRTTGWHRHDLRRTGATIMGEMSIPPHVIEAAANHVAIHSRLASNYNTSRYTQDVANALQRLADTLDRIEGGVTSLDELRAADTKAEAARTATGREAAQSRA